MTDTARPEELLTRVGLFATLGRVELAKLAAYLEPVEVPAGGEVFRQGETGDSLYIVTEGAFGVLVASGDRRNALRLSTLAPGDLFGEMALFTGEPRSATVVADRPSTVLQLPRERFLVLMRREPAISLTIVATLSERLRTANQAQVEHADFVAATIEQALRRLPAERREAVFEASLLETMTAPPAGAVRRPGGVGRCRSRRARCRRQCGARHGARPAGVVRARARPRGRHRARHRRGDAPGRRRLLERRAGRPRTAVDAGALRRDARARAARRARAGRGSGAPWIEHVDDERASQDGDLALTRALLHESRGDTARALGVLQRALGVALVGSESATGPRLAAEIARLSNSRSPDAGVSPIEPTTGPSRAGGVVCRRCWRWAPAASPS